MTREVALLSAVGCCLFLAARVVGEQPTPPDDGAAETTAAKQVQLQFREQPWLEVLEWLAEQSNLNLDWQELPDGTLNLSSSSSYDLADAHDLINMQLMARGYTLLSRGEVLRVVALADLDPTLVTRVEPDELAKLPRHQFVRVSFPMEWIVAEEAAEEFVPLMSPYGKLHAMAQTNRLEAIDAVVNLRELHRLLTEADADEQRRERVTEFVLEHRRAEDVAPKVRQLLGLPPEPVPTATAPTQLDIEKTRLRSEAVKQLGEGAKQLLHDKPQVQLVVNEQENSILVHARSDKIEIARQAIEALDKPVPPKESPWESANRVQTYPVEGFDAATIIRLVDSMRQNEKLDEATRVDHEAAYNRLVVFAKPDDQLAIASLIRNFQSEQREAAVIDLRSLEPIYAAKAIEAILKNPTRPDKAPGTASNGRFQVEADVANRRLLLWATTREVGEVRGFLEQLGELETADVETATTTHVVPTHGARVTDIEDRLQQVWSQVSTAPLHVESAAESEQQEETDGTRDSPPAEVPTEVDSKETRAGRSIAGRLVAQSQPADEDKTRGPDSSVRVIEGAAGQLIIVSDDPRAAALARTIAEGLLPPVDEIRSVALEHAAAPEVGEQLQELLDRQYSREASSLSPPSRYSIDVDDRTNSLVLQSLSADQLQLVEQMVKVLDQPTPHDEELIRTQQIYQAQHVQSDQLAENLKEVYRDLLSKSDKSFSGNSERSTLGYSGTGVGGEKSPRYQGLLSISSQAESNSVIVSAPQYLIDEVLDLARRLDKPPVNSSIGFVQLAPGSRPEEVMKALGLVLKGEDDD